MKPAFALSLSSDGIALIHRAADGWRSVAETPFDNEDLPQALAAMREQALRLAPEGVTCKLVLPQDQIRYLTVDTGEADEAARLAAARKALEGATPYAVDELAFDICADGPRTHVAAVALETLDEAESFALEHQFAPVSFVAQPAAAQACGFKGEPFFGTARAIRGTEVTPDRDAVAVLGPAVFPAAKAAADAARDPQAEAAAAGAAPAPAAGRETPPQAAPAADPELDPATDLPAGLALEVEPELDLEPELNLEDALQQAADPKVAPPPPPAGGKAVTGAADDAAPQISASAAKAGAGADTRAQAASAAGPARQAASADANSGPRPAEPASPAPAPRAGGKSEDSSAVEDAAGGGTPPAKDTAKSPEPVGKPGAAATGAKPPAATQAVPTPAAAPVVPPAPPVKPAGAAAPALRGSEGKSSTSASPRSTGGKDAKPAKPVPAAAVPVPPPGAAKPLGAAAPAASAQGSTPAVKAPAAARAAAPVPPAPAPLEPTAPRKAPEKPARKIRAAGGKPRYLGVVLTAFLLLFMATVAVWALYGEDGFWAAPEALDSPGAAPSADDGDSAPQDSSSGTGLPQYGQQPQEAPAIAPQVSVLPDQPDPGVEEIIPQPPAAAAAPLDLADGADSEEAGAAAEAAVAAALDPGAGAEPSPEDEAAADGVDLPEEGTGSAFVDPASLAPGQQEAPLQPETAAEAAAADDAPLDPLAAAARYAATGVWPDAPELDAAPQAAALDSLYTASIDRTDLAADAVALPQPGSFERDLEPSAVASPAAPGSAFELDERGLVKASREGTLNPDGVTVYLGRPQKVPPPAPGRGDADAEALAEAVARDQLLSRLRPRTRPADLAERIERAQLGGLSREELARVRPRQRPPSLKPANEDQLPVTAQAVASSVVPRSRPANFANLVDRARRNSQNDASRTAAAAVPAAAAAPAPSIPTTASVARRATVNGAINLRKVNLIGVYGTASNRSALIRLPSGRYKKVQVGDRIDGGRIIAIGDGQLQYQKGGRNRTLTMPKG